MSTARLLVGDVFDRLADIQDGSVDLVLTSPPFLALRSYLPADHPDKAREIGSESTPAEYLDTLLRLTAEWRRVLAPHGSLCVELGDTYAGSGGAGGDYNAGGLRDGQERFNGAAANARAHAQRERTRTPPTGWPLDKSLTGIPTLYAWSLAYGRNLLTGEESPAGMWRIRTVKPWVRTNPPVGSLGDKDRPATSYVIVATRARDRWFDLDAVRTTSPRTDNRRSNSTSYAAPGQPERRTRATDEKGDRLHSNTAGAPPLDWYHEVDGVLDAALREYANGTTNARTAKGVDRRANTGKAAAPGRGGGWSTLGVEHGDNGSIRGWHLRRALEAAGFFATAEALDVTAKGYAGAHYAVWPPELCRLLIEEMCPRRVCRTCGQPSRRIVDVEHATGEISPSRGKGRGSPQRGGDMARVNGSAVTTAGWTSCGCPGTDGLRLDGFHDGDGWRPGLVLDPFAGSCTTLAVATGHGRDAIGIDLDSRNADLARGRLGMFLEVDDPKEIPA